MRSPKPARMAKPVLSAPSSEHVKKGREPALGMADPGSQAGKQNLKFSPTPAPGPRSHQIAVAHKAGSNTAALVPLTLTCRANAVNEANSPLNAVVLSPSPPSNHNPPESVSWHPSFHPYRTVRRKAWAPSCPSTVENLCVLVCALISCQVSGYGATSPDISISPARLTVAPH